MNILTIIPARKGSKGIPGKNTLKFAGKSLLAHTVDCARNAQAGQDIVLNTDSEELIAEAESLGIQTILRDKKDSQDDSMIAPVIVDTLYKCESINKRNYDLVLLLQLTAPLRSGQDIDNCVKILESNDTDSVISVVQMGDIHPARMYQVDRTGHLQTLGQQNEFSRRQDLPEVFLRNGCIYLAKTAAVKKENAIITKNKMPYVMDEKWWVNLDTEKDLVLLNYLFPKYISENSFGE